MRKHPSPFESTLLQLGDRNFHFFFYVENTHKKHILCLWQRHPVPELRENIRQCVETYRTAGWEWKLVTSTNKWKLLFPWHLFSFTMFCLLGHLDFFFSRSSFNFFFHHPDCQFDLKMGPSPHSSLSSLQVQDRNLWQVCCVVLRWLVTFGFELLYKVAICLVIGKKLFCFRLLFKLFKSWVENKIISGIYLLFPEASSSFIYYGGTENRHLEMPSFTKDTLVSFC